MAHIACALTADYSSEHRLVNYSPSERPWDVHRAQADIVSAIYGQAFEFERYARYSERIAQCSGVLRFSYHVDRDSGESQLKLHETHFCRVRHCPICQWRRTLMWLARFYQSLPSIIESYPTVRWLFLTLTVRNCAITNLGETLTAMQRGWHRLKDRKEFVPVIGWIRTTEVTRGTDGSAHPHFHALLMVRPSMLTTRYVPHRKWVEIWRSCMRLDYDPIVDIRVVKNRVVADGTVPALRAAASEVLKYSVKPSDMCTDDAWFLELTRQVHRRRFIATGGVLKDVLRENQESDEDLALVDSDGSDERDERRLAFAWRMTEKHYVRAPEYEHDYSYTPSPPWVRG